MHLNKKIIIISALVFSGAASSHKGSTLINYQDGFIYTQKNESSQSHITSFSKKEGSGKKFFMNIGIDDVNGNTLEAVIDGVAPSFMSAKSEELSSKTQSDLLTNLVLRTIEGKEYVTRDVGQGIESFKLGFQYELPIGEVKSILGTSSFTYNEMVRCKLQRVVLKGVVSSDNEYSIKLNANALPVSRKSFAGLSFCE